MLANLANFAYDPINYPWFRRLKIIDIFLNQASERTQALQSFAVSGLCNLALGWYFDMYHIYFKCQIFLSSF